MIVGKIISIFDISVEVILSDESIKIGDILRVENSKDYVFEVVNINNISATCISLNTTRGLKKGSNIQIKYWEEYLILMEIQLMIKYLIVLIRELLIMRQLV